MLGDECVKGRRGFLMFRSSCFVVRARMRFFCNRGYESGRLSNSKRRFLKKESAVACTVLMTKSEH